ncbi:hypothetical protein K435DRAFT_878985 [Dendrothele bispora CBS 962.96]|uniref:Uncharacterized protein n=1 Tax=Dendrothele bispora (strain CBS 962.96) TaxID=1314807 RepID=A0A4V6T4V7_DENBC|nr:hypothetical protein K435DRAFT_878985 [Dendrothele bispora CBS 962.96]
MVLLYLVSHNSAAKKIVARPPLVQVGSLEVYGLAMERMNECISKQECSRGS